MPALLGFALVTALQIFWGGFVASSLWGWFVVPLGLSAISYWHAVGLCCLLTLFVGGQPPADDRTDIRDDILYEALAAVLKPAFMLLVGWVAYHQLVQTWFDPMRIF